MSAVTRVVATARTWCEVAIRHRGPTSRTATRVGADPTPAETQMETGLSELPGFDHPPMLTGTGGVVVAQ